MTTKEMQRILNYLRRAARYCGHLERAGGFENVFDRIGANLYSIDTDEDGLCLFAYRDEAGIRCALHSVALDLAIPLDELKPMSCLLWPLSISSGRNKVVSVLDDVYAFPCNTRRRVARPSLDATVAELIERAFGAETRARVEKAERRAITSIT